MSVQELLTKFYDIDNLVTIEVSIPDADWVNVKDRDSRFSWRADVPSKGFLTESHYDWFKTTSVSISGTKYPTQKQLFNSVSIIKKSFGGSESKIKPSLKLEFGRISKKDELRASQADMDNAKKSATSASALVGSKHLTLNNCKQDASYVRQPLGYEIFRQGGIPFARCNFAKVIVNGKSFGTYVNLQQIQEPYLQRNFNNDKGNLYETEWKFDLTPTNLAKGLSQEGKVSNQNANKEGGKGFNQEGFSSFKDQKDLALAVSKFDQGLTVAKQVIDVDQITRVMAMQAVVKNWDGYPNNTFVYNDKVAVENPTVNDVKLKLIPSGIDAIYYAEKPFEVKDEGILSKLVLTDNDAKAQLKKRLQDCASTFDQSLNANLSLVDKMFGVLKSGAIDGPSFDTTSTLAPLDQVMNEIGIVKTQLNGVKMGLDALVRGL